MGNYKIPKYGIVSKRGGTDAEIKEWTDGVTSVLSTYGIWDFQSIQSENEEDEITCVYFPVTATIHRELLQSGLKVGHIVDEYVYYAGAISKKLDFGDMYIAFEKKYNPYPVQMSRAEAFRKALDDGLIDKHTYLEAAKYYGKLWNYVGD